MNKLSVLVAAWGIVSLAGPMAHANDLVQFPTQPASWTVNLTTSQNPTPPDPSIPPNPHPSRVVKVEVTQDAQKRRYLVTWSSGKTVERWGMPGLNLILAEEPNGNIISVPNAGFIGQAFAVPYGDAAFNWLKPEFLADKDPISYQGKLCFHYKGTFDPSDGKLNPTYRSTGKCGAWIDSKTLLPVALDDGDAFATYTFKQDPPPPLVPPAKFQVVFNRLNR